MTRINVVPVQDEDFEKVEELYKKVRCELSKARSDYSDFLLELGEVILDERTIERGKSLLKSYDEACERHRKLMRSLEYATWRSKKAFVNPDEESN